MCISQARSTWGIQLSEDLRFKTSADQRLGTGAVQSCWENSGYCVQCTLPITFTIFQNFQKKSVEPCHWQVTTQFIKFKPVPIYWELSFILLIKFLLFLMAILEAKIFKIQNFFTSFEKSEQQTHLLWTHEYLERTSTFASRTVTPQKRNMAKHYGEDLHFGQDAVIIQKISIKNKKKKSSLSWKPEKAT